MRRRMWIMAAVAGVGLAVAVASPALATSGTTLPAGGMACVDQTKSDRGVAVYGYSSNGTATWTVFVSATVGGPETEVLRMTARSIEPAYAYAPSEGTFYYRACLTNASASETMVSYRLRTTNLKPYGGSGTFGATTATLGPGGRVCGDFADGVVHLTGHASVPVEFSVWGWDFESYTPSWQVFSVTDTVVDEVVRLDESQFFGAEACVTNTSTTTAEVLFELD